MPTADRVASIVEPQLAAIGVELVDVEHKGAVVRVVLDEPGGISLERLTEITRRLSKALDDADPITARYTLEVSSPGVERPLRTPRHFAAVVGQVITFKWAGEQGAQRITGTLISTDDRQIEVLEDPPAPVADPGNPPQARRFDYHAIERARTVFEWGPAPKPGKGSKPGAARKTAADRKSVGAGKTAAANPPAPVTTSTAESGERPALAPGSLDNGVMP
ncbi:MAG: ribosome maturation factor RimP [Acidimicrobiales bacterium]